MFLRVGLQAENNVLDRMCYHFSGLKGVKMADIAPLKCIDFIDGCSIQLLCSDITDD